MKLGKSYSVRKQEHFKTSLLLEHHWFSMCTGLSSKEVTFGDRPSLKSLHYHAPPNGDGNRKRAVGSLTGPLYHKPRTRVMSSFPVAAKLAVVVVANAAKPIYYVLDCAIVAVTAIND